MAKPVSAANSPVDIYHIDMRQFKQQLLPGFGQTTLWGYVDANDPTYPNNARYLGPLIVARKDKPVRIIVTNLLPNKHILPVDTTIMGSEPGQFENRASLHLHGGLTPWTSDGGPFAWFTPGPWNTPGKNKGVSFLIGNGKDGQAQYDYPNNQSARLMWYHDHAIGNTRLNAYAGIASGYLLGDDFEDFLVKLGIIPATQIPLIIQDKSFNSDGSLWYPTAYEGPPANAIPGLPNVWERLTQSMVNGLARDTGRWDRDVTAPLPPAISCIPEFFSDTILVNGAPYPVANVPPTRVRFRILNGSQARFYNLQLYYESLKVPGEADLTKAGPPMIQIGNEGGFLFAPAVLNNPPRQIGFDTNPASPTFGNATRYNLLLAPAERADLIIDFSGAAGRNLIMYSDAPAPFPMGDQRNDYYTNDLNMTPIGGAMSTSPGMGPNTRTLMRFTVATSAPSNIMAPAMSHEALVSSLSQSLLPLSSHLLQGSAVRTRDLTLNEDFDEFGRLIQMEGTNRKITAKAAGYGRGYMDTPTETPRAGDIEIWRIFNLTGDTHPIHFHLVNVQVLGRQPFDAGTYEGTPTFTAPFRGPDANELGFKETVRMNPNEMTVVIMKFDLPKVAVPTPPSPRTGGHEYVWHCHILEHEEHDMMRPLVVTG